MTSIVQTLLKVSNVFEKFILSNQADTFLIYVLLFSDSVNVFVDKWVKSGSVGIQKLLEVVPEHED